ncbi:MAG TPA: vitamin K epoxide reductase family protein [Gemmatimonadaceae bacterium]
MLSRRQLAALLALVGLFIATYLTLHNLGIIGTLTCTVGSCETVQTSKWARFLGLPVAMWGAGFYLSMLVLALLGESASHAEARWVPGLMLAFSGIGVLFSAWLTWLELYVIHAICMYCVASAVITVLLFAVSLLDWQASRDGAS